MLIAPQLEEATPEPPVSVAPGDAVTPAWFRAIVPVDKVGASCGLIVSILNDIESEPELPARSWQDDDTMTEEPSPLDMVVWVHWLVSIPEPPPSVQCQATTTLVVYQPLVPSVPDTCGASVGGSVSTVQVNVAGDWSVLPAASVARTWKVCEPSRSPV